MIIVNFKFKLRDKFKKNKIYGLVVDLKAKQTNPHPHTHCHTAPHPHALHRQTDRQRMASSAKERFQQLAAQEEAAKKQKEEEQKKSQEAKRLKAEGGQTKIGTKKGQIKAFATGECANAVWRLLLRRGGSILFCDTDLVIFFFLKKISI